MCRSAAEFVEVHCVDRVSLVPERLAQQQRGKPQANAAQSAAPIVPTVRRAAAEIAAIERQRRAELSREASQRFARTGECAGIRLRCNRRERLQVRQ